MQRNDKNQSIQMMQYIQKRKTMQKGKKNPKNALIA